jgi:hypothetical protein
VTEPRTPHGRLGRQLWALLPEHHRVRDAETDGDLARFVDAAGAVLEEVRGTIDQRLAEVTPGARRPVLRDPADPSEIQRVPQDWLLPYYADLLAVRLVSPDPDGQRGELERAIAWRKGSGTLAVAGEAATTVADTDVVVAEGRALVVVTPRVDMPVLPGAAFTDTPTPLADLRRQPLAAARDPNLPTGTVDVRDVARAVLAAPSHPQAQRRPNPDGPDIVWRHLSLRGVPCFPGSHEDPLVRTPDVRNPGQRQGHHHPSRVVAYLAPMSGHFPPPSRTAQLGAVTFGTDELHELSDTVVASLEVTAGQLWCRNVTVTGALSIRAAGVHRFDDVIVLGGPVTAVDGARLETLRSAMPDVVLGNTGAARRGTRIPLDPELPGPIGPSDVLVARDCLFRAVASGKAAIGKSGRITLDGVTVLGATRAGVVRASETILAGSAVIGRPVDSCVRFSRIPPKQAKQLSVHAVTTAAPLFEPCLDCSAWGNLEPATWGEPGCGVLDMDSPASVLRGAEDGTELGAYHHLRFAALPRAVVEKLTGLLPVGIEAAVVLDRRLWAQPPTVTQQP